MLVLRISIEGQSRRLREMHALSIQCAARAISARSCALVTCSLDMMLLSHVTFSIHKWN